MILSQRCVKDAAPYAILNTRSATKVFAPLFSKSGQRCEDGVPAKEGCGAKLLQRAVPAKTRKSNHFSLKHHVQNVEAVVHKDDIGFFADLKCADITVKPYHAGRIA